MDLRLLWAFLALAAAEAPRFVHPTPRTVKIDRGRRMGPCGDGDRSGHVTEISPGPLTVSWEEPVNNKGSQFRIALSRNGSDEFEECILVNNIPHNDASNPVWDEEKQEFTFTEYSLTVEIPDVNCDDCALQLVNIVTGDDACTYDPAETENGLNGRCSTNYHSCSNVKISGGQYARDKFTCEAADWSFSKGDAYSYSKSAAPWLDTLLMDRTVPAAFRNTVPESVYDEGTVVALVNNQYDDAVENLKTDSVQRANEYIELKSQFVTALRFRDVPLPADMEIVDARLTLWVMGNSGNDTDSSGDSSVVTSFGMSFEKEANSGPILSGNLDITSRTLTDSDNSVSGHIVASQSGRWTSNDLKDTLQEVVDETEWESGNALTLIIDVELDGGGLKVQTYESSHPAELLIKYRKKLSPGETPAPTPNPTPKPDQPCTYALHQRILGNWQRGGDWYNGRIDKVHENKDGIADLCSYDVIYDDGDKEEGVVNRDLTPETKHARDEFQLRELVDVKVNNVWERGLIRILQKEGTYTVETIDGDVYPNVEIADIRQWVEFFVGDTVEIRQCWWFKAEITKVQPDGRYQCLMEDGYSANVPFNDMREIVDVRYESGETVKLFVDGKWEDGFVIIPNEDGTYMVGVSKTNVIENSWPADKMSKAGGGR